MSAGRSVVVLALLSALALAGAQTHEVVPIDFYKDILYSPADTWSSTAQNEVCSAPDHFTSTVGSSALIHFVGDKIQVNGMRNNASGVVNFTLDDNIPILYDAWSEDVYCDVLQIFPALNGSHTLTITLVGPHTPEPIITTEGGSTSPVLHLTNITYYVPLTAPATVAPGGPVESSTPTFVADLGTSHHKNVGVIVGPVIAGVVGLAAIVAALFLLYRRRTMRKARHTFNPNAVYMAELSPRTTTEPDYDAKLGPYVQMEDDGDYKSADAKMGALGVPSLDYNPSKGGLRSRSRSPMPDRNPMP